MHVNERLIAMMNDKRGDATGKPKRQATDNDHESWYAFRFEFALKDLEVSNQLPQ